MAVAAKGIDVRQSTSHLLFRASLKDSSGNKVTSGTTTLSLYEYQSDGTLKSYDFSDNTFKTGALTTATLAMTHRTGNNGTVNTGLWTAVLSTLTGFTAGAIYMVQVTNSGATPNDQEREFQFGSAEGDLAVTTTGYLKSDAEEWKGGTIPAVNVTGRPLVDVTHVIGAPATGTGGTIDATLVATGLDAIAATAPTSLATTFVGKLMQMWEWMYGKKVKTTVAGQGTIQVMQGTGSTPAATQTFTSALGVDTVNKAT